MIHAHKRNQLEREIQELLNKKNKTLQDINRVAGIQWALNKY